MVVPLGTIFRNGATAFLTAYFVSKVFSAAIKWNSSEIGTRVSQAANEWIVFPSLTLCMIDENEESTVETGTFKPIPKPTPKEQYLTLFQYTKRNNDNRYVGLVA